MLVESRKRNFFHMNNSSETLLKVENLSKHFPITKGVFRRQVGTVKAVDGISFEIKERETLGLVGESGFQSKIKTNNQSKIFKNN
ncbi:MAG: hypothetical protein VXC58_17680, partial [Deltaproteobacteria bacterium]